MARFCGGKDQACMLGHAYSIIISSVILLITVPALPPPAWAQARVLETAILHWSIIQTPGSISDKNDIRPHSEVNSILVASDGKTIYTIDIPMAMPPPAPNPGIWKSSDNGISFSSKPTKHLTEAIPAPFLPVMDIAVAPDDPNFLAAVCLNNLGTLRHEVYLSDDGGTTWIYSGAIPWTYGGGEQIGDIAILKKTNEGFLIMPGQPRSFLDEFRKVIASEPPRTGKPENWSPSKMKAIWSPT